MMSLKSDVITTPTSSQMHIVDLSNTLAATTLAAAAARKVIQNKPGPQSSLVAMQSVQSRERA